MIKLEELLKEMREKYSSLLILHGEVTPKTGVGDYTTYVYIIDKQRKGTKPLKDILTGKYIEPLVMKIEGTNKDEIIKQLNGFNSNNSILK